MEAQPEFLLIMPWNQVQNMPPTQMCGEWDGSFHQETLRGPTWVGLNHIHALIPLFFLPVGSMKFYVLASDLTIKVKTSLKNKA